MRNTFIYLSRTSSCVPSVFRVAIYTENYICTEPKILTKTQSALAQVLAGPRVFVF